ncbi:unnamed protein product [Tuber melanosporum]|uniref:(Perigord truffle) hypothetical protein n=1 Tax=Tuber melanosporum (strain Mel28) TaxID=656061 RepID=D5GKD9_TUBMM|nr:uncharacterized protein GSTUM_00009495001 [Tuber melanosporum]CAZ84982.1 unnamed protein product [Tuber melanosporum]
MPRNGKSRLDSFHPPRTTIGTTPLQVRVQHGKTKAPPQMQYVYSSPIAYKHARRVLRPQNYFVWH